MTPSVITVFLLLAFPTAQSQDYLDDPPTTTECTNNPNSSACQKPEYIDDLSEFFIDLDASYTFENGAPSTGGPSIFYGVETRNDNASKFQDEATGNSVLEQYVENPGEAGTSQWGRGTLENTTVSLSGAENEFGVYGDRLLGNLNPDSCGDGIGNTGGRSSCPQDHGLPDRPFPVDYYNTGDDGSLMTAGGIRQAGFPTEESSCFSAGRRSM
jgi:hypothetical protein